MRFHADRAETRWADLRVSRIGLLSTALLLLMFSCCCRKIPPKPPEAVLPDLNDCTRVQIRLCPSALRWLGVTTDEEGLLSRTEIEHAESMNRIVSTDTALIQNLAEHVAEAEYTGRKGGVIRMERFAHVGFYREDKPVLSLTAVLGHLEIADGRSFEGKFISSSLSRFVEPLWPYQWRVDCACHLTQLHRILKSHAASADKRYFSYAEWCDVVQPQATLTHLRCPVLYDRNPDYYMVNRQTCHYAMNPACEPNSPADMVLLFETKEGWNQHGGPELFTFDNHDPRGGCVLLNDGTVKFIRTEEELAQLRWK